MIGLPSLQMQAFREWRDPDLNRGHHDFQSCALPTELSRRGRERVASRTGSGPGADPDDPACRGAPGLAVPASVALDRLEAGQGQLGIELRWEGDVPDEL